MKTISLSALTLVAALSLNVHAAEKLPYGFLKSNPQEVASLASQSGLVYSYDMRSSAEWDASTVKESALFSGFQSFESWDMVNNTNETIIYVSEVAFVMDKVVDQASLERLGAADFLSDIDPGFTHEAIPAERANAAYGEAQASGRDSSLNYLSSLVKKGQLSEAEKARLAERIEGQYQANVSKSWCGDQTQCLESTARIPFLYRQLLAGASLAGVDVPDSVKVQSELRSLSASELKAQGASAGVVQVGFLSNKSLISMKNLILATGLGSGSSLVTIKTYVVIEKDDLDKFQSLGSYDFVVGNSYLNSDEGITMGLPLYAQRLAEALREKL